MEAALLRARKVLHGVRSDRGRQALGVGVGASIEHFAAFVGREYDTVIDIGGNRGQFALFARSRFPKSRIISFEPLSECAILYRKIFNDDPETVLHEVAVGPCHRSEVMHVTSDIDSSSFLPPAKPQQAIFGSRKDGERKIQMVRLSEKVAAEDVGPRTLLKIDVQGFELQVLRGCDDLLPLFLDIYVECSYVELYEGQTSASEVVTFLAAHGFGLAGVFNQFVDPAVGPVQADLLFRRESVRRLSGNPLQQLSGTSD